jgi:hypothetical protein
MHRKRREIRLLILFKYWFQVEAKQVNSTWYISLCHLQYPALLVGTEWMDIRFFSLPAVLNTTTLLYAGSLFD